MTSSTRTTLVPTSQRHAEQDESIRLRVREYQTRNPVGTGSEADAFPAFWLATHHGVGLLDAAAHCSSGSGDRGLDAFHLSHVSGDAPVLWLYQAKYSSAREMVKQGATDLVRLVPTLAKLLRGEVLDTASANPLMDRLRATLDRERALVPHLRLRFVVLHLCPDDPELIAEATRLPREALARAADDSLSDYVVETLRLVGPSDIEHVPDVASGRRTERSVYFDGAELKASFEGAHYYAGLTRLADLVALYDEYHDALFERNVRLYLHSEGQKGPGSHMRQTLREICDRRNQTPLAPECFAMYHNGVTIHARQARLEGDRLHLKDPSVLNGCQTVKNSYFFRNDTAFAPHLDADRWAAVAVPVRVLVTNKDELVRRVAVSNNRQTEIRPSAFYANDPTQITLAQRFSEQSIFYERQQGAFKNRRQSQGNEFFEQYANSLDAPITIEELAQAIAVAADRPALSVASKVSQLFDESQYQKVFAARRTEHLQLLVFLRNVLRWMPTALTDLRGGSASSREALDKLPIGKFKYTCARVVARYVVANRPDDVRRYGLQVLGSASRARPLRSFLVLMLQGAHTNMYKSLPDIWREAPGVWRNPLDAALLNSVMCDLGLEKFDPFAGYEPPA